MADHTPSTQTPVTYEALLANRMAVWSSFTSGTTIASVLVILIVIFLFVFVF